MLLLLPLMFTSACATNTVATSECSWVKIITVSKDDVLTDQTAREILTHNETVEQVCGR